MRRFIASLLIVSALLAILPAALAVTPTFPDITDPQTARDVASLQMLGIIDGDGGFFKPDDTLTRAAFCKMAVIAMGRGDEEPQYRSRTVFPDVRSNHWARGYINLAVSGENRIIAGNSDGNFRPDDNITYAQAVTILVRILGYSDADAGMLWPTGYLNLASSSGLTKGISLGAGEPIRRSTAARLFCNLLAANTKDGKKYLTSLGTAEDDVIIMALDVTAADGSTDAILTTAGTLKSSSGIVPEALLGLRGTLVKDSAGNMLTFLPGDGKSVTFTASSADARWIKSTDGKKYDFTDDPTVYSPDKTAPLSEIFADIAPGMQVTVFYKDDKADCLYINTSRSADALIVTSDKSNRATFNALTGGAVGYTIIRNGAEASFSDIQKYDVATYDKSSNTLSVSDFRLTACYESVWPNPQYPSKLQLIGAEFQVLPSASDNLSEFTPGQVATFLFTADNQIAGAISSKTLHASPLGIVDSASPSDAKVTLLNGMSFTGNPGLNDKNAAELGGELVTVYSDKIGAISLIKVYRTASFGDFDLERLTVGSSAVAADVEIFERVGKSGVRQVSLSDLNQSKIPGSRIIHAQLGANKKVSLIILDDATGDLYTYGFMKQGFDEIYPPDDDAGYEGEYRQTITLTSKDKSVGPIRTNLEFKNGALGGIAVSTDGTSVTGLVTLAETSKIARSAFRTTDGVTYVNLGKTEMIVSEDVICYNKSTGGWFNSLAEARAYASSLTVYYDSRDNGKIRVVVAG